MDFGNSQTQKDVVAKMVSKVMDDPDIKKAINDVVDAAKKEIEEKKALIKEFNAEVKGWTYDHLFIKVTDGDGFVTGRDSWRGFEELTEELRNDAIAKGYRDIKVNMRFV